LAALIEFEPIIGVLLDEAAGIAPPDDQYWRQYEQYKRRLRSLVGYGADRPELAAPEAYEIVVTAMADVLSRRATV